jgi:hypothetical protein
MIRRRLPEVLLFLALIGAVAFLALVGAVALLAWGFAGMRIGP